MDRRYFSTLDINLASWLSLHGIEPALENRNGKVIFNFESSDELYRLMNDYNSNEAVRVLDFVTRQKILRGQLITMKRSHDARPY